MIQPPSEEECEELTIEEALIAVHSQPELTRASPNIQQAVNARIQGLVY